MTADHRELAETYLTMLNSHDPDVIPALGLGGQERQP